MPENRMTSWDSMKYCRMECVIDHSKMIFQTWSQDSAFQWFNKFR